MHSSLVFILRPLKTGKRLLVKAKSRTKRLMDRTNNRYPEPVLVGGQIVSLKVSWTFGSSEVLINPKVHNWTNKVIISMQTARNKAIETACISFSSFRSIMGERQNPRKMLQNSFLMTSLPNQLEDSDKVKISLVSEAIVFPTSMNITIQIPKDVRNMTVEIRKTLVLPRT